MDGSKVLGLLCPMCFDILTTATTLGCGHSFCQMCLQANDGAKCPLCGEDTTIGRTPGEEEINEDVIQADGADLPALGDLHLGDSPAANANPAETSMQRAEEHVEETGTCAATVPKIVNTIQIPRRACNINGMAALTKDSVVVGYGWDGKGSDCFTVSGDKTQHLKNTVGNVCDIAFLSDGKSVVSLGTNIGRVYDSDGSEMDTKYTFIQGLGHPGICSDQNDNVYVVNGNPAIYIFKGNNKKPHTIVPTDKVLPLQVCVTSTGAIVTSTCNFTRGRITVYDKAGAVGSSILAKGDDNDEDNEDGECLYAAVDDRDRVLIARVRRWSSVISLTRYALEGTKLVEDVAFEDVTGPRQIDMNCWCYMVCLTTKSIAFANGCVLFFIDIPA